MRRELRETRCDVCGLLKPAEPAGWNRLSIDFRVQHDSNDANKTFVWQKVFGDLCHKCSKMMSKRVMSALTWSVTL